MRRPPWRVFPRKSPRLSSRSGHRIALVALFVAGCFGAMALAQTNAENKDVVIKLDPLEIKASVRSPCASADKASPIWPSECGPTRCAPLAPRAAGSTLILGLARCPLRSALAPMSFHGAPPWRSTSSAIPPRSDAEFIGGVSPGGVAELRRAEAPIKPAPCQLLRRGPVR